MLNWPHKVGTYSPLEVRTFCVEDAEWQKFRLSLKGIPTTDKLKNLNERRNVLIREYDGTLPRRYQVQIDNYINALRRGGQLDLDNKVQR